MFALELRAAHLREIALELAEPGLPLSDLDRSDRERLPPNVRANWSGIQTLVAQTIAAKKPVTTEPEISHYISAVIRQRSYHWHSLRHADDDAGRFRSDLTDNVGAVLGTPLIANLVRRPIATLVADAHPYYGWSTNRELRAALAEPASTGIPAREQRTRNLHGFVVSIHAAVERGYDLVTIYDGATTAR